MGKHHDWKSIEKDYHENGLSYSQVAEKYGISIDSIKKAASKYGWARKRKDAASNSLVKSIETALDKTAPEETAPENGTGAEIVPLYPDRVLPAESDAERFQRLVNDLMDRVEDAICHMDVTNAGAIKLMTGALKDLRSLKGLDKSALDIEEQKARIEKLRREAMVEEENREITVSIRGMTQDEIDEVIG